MIFGADLSSYDGSDGTVVDPYSFVILNVKDPGIAAKINRAKAQGIPWALYTWLGSKDGTNPVTVWARRAVAQYGVPPKGVWLDYEEAGVTPQLLVDNLIAAEQEGMNVGVYTYLGTIASVANNLRGHPLWLAYYPYPNDGNYPANQIGDAQKWGAKIWQYTSTNGTRDLDVILDEAWWASWGTGGTGDMFTVTQMDTLGQWEKDTRKQILDTVLQWLTDVEARLKAYMDTKFAAMPSGSGGGLSADQVRAIVREELNKTGLHG